MMRVAAPPFAGGAASTSGRCCSQPARTSTRCRPVDSGTRMSTMAELRTRCCVDGMCQDLPANTKGRRQANKRQHTRSTVCNRQLPMNKRSDPSTTRPRSAPRTLLAPMKGSAPAQPPSRARRARQPTSAAAPAARRRAGSANTADTAKPLPLTAIERHGRTSKNCIRLTPFAALARFTCRGAVHGDLGLPGCSPIRSRHAKDSHATSQPTRARLAAERLLARAHLTGRWRPARIARRSGAATFHRRDRIHAY